MKPLRTLSGVTGVSSVTPVSGVTGVTSPLTGDTTPDTGCRELETPEK
jgi:hypothetical protein